MRDEHIYLEHIKEKLKGVIDNTDSAIADRVEEVKERVEEKIWKTSIEQPAAETLENKYKFQSLSDQVSKLLKKPDEKYQERIPFKSGFEFISELNESLVYFENEYFKPVDFVISRNPVPENCV